LDYTIDYDALDSGSCFGRSNLDEAAQRSHLLGNCALKAKAPKAPTECLKRWDGRGQPSPTCFRAQGKAVGPTHSRQSRDQRRVVEVARHKMVWLGGRDHVVFLSESARGEEIKLWSRHSCMMQMMAFEATADPARDFAAVPRLASQRKDQNHVRGYGC